jgi:xanthosine utilization system XapX-like protein
MKYIISIGLLFVSMAVVAQSAPPATPIDGGLGILLAGGAVYGIKRIVQLKKNL